MKHTPTGMVASHSRGRSRRAFTVLEITVSLAALLVISLGLVAILTAVGKTVTGGRKVSRLNTAAQLVEQQIRADIAQMSSQGFLVIRQQYVDSLANGRFDDPQVAGANADRVPLSEDDTNGRARRIDEVLFFRTGKFSSKRMPLNADAAPVAGQTARIYIGHGQHRAEDFTANSLYLRPLPSDRMLGQSALGAPVAGNPDRYAAAWTLLRHALLLAKPRDIDSYTFVTTPIFGVDPASPTGRARMADSRFQIAMLPAAPSVFRSMNFTYPRPFAVDVLRETVVGDADPRGVSIASGLIDVAATDILEVRAATYGFAANGSGGLLPGALAVNTFPPLPLANYAATPYDPSAAPIATRPATPEPLDVIHTWMEDALPAQSDPTVSGAYLAHGETPGSRMRAESASPNLIDVIADDPQSDAQGMLQSNEASDQRMLQSSNLLVGCTEFIVEWSLGEFDALGRQRWYGLTRYAGDTDGDGVVDANDWVVTRPYGVRDPLDPNWSLYKIGVPVVLPDEDGDGTIDNQPYQHPVTPRLIYGIDPDVNGSNIVLTSHFGDIDPTYSRDSAREIVNTPNNVADDPVASQVPWVWPKMLRFTVSITDPSLPNYENTFQFVVALPARGSNSSN